ncbi:MAG: EamA family transporter, partial [Paracoccaceae bacterium]
SVALRMGRLAEMTPVAMLGGVFAAIAAAIILAATGQPLIMSPTDTAYALALGAVILAAGMILYTLGARVLPAAEATLISLIEVLLAPLWVWLILGETASDGTFIGGGILLTAVVLNALAGARRQMTEGVAPGP